MRSTYDLPAWAARTSSTRHASVSWICAMVIVSACGSRESDDCPAGTSPSVVALGRTRVRECHRSDRTPHGPVVEIDENGVKRRVGQWGDGEKVGTWRVYLRGKVFSESTFVAGELTRVVNFQEDGRPLTWSEYEDGFAHGKERRWNAAGLVVEREYTRGQRSGTWHRHSPEKETRVYDARGVLVSVNGKIVSPPEVQIELPDGTILEREKCGRASLEQPSADRCHDLFEAFQLCQFDSDPTRLAACHERAFEDYRRPVRL